MYILYIKESLVEGEFLLSNDDPDNLFAKTEDSDVITKENYFFAPFHRYVMLILYTIYHKINLRI
jgi:hypothetical protein